jgi:hypothetical protein
MVVAVDWNHLRHGIATRQGGDTNGVSGERSELGPDAEGGRRKNVGPVEASFGGLTKDRVRMPRQPSDFERGQRALDQLGR